MTDTVIHLDRQIKTPRNDVASAFTFGTTTWTLPFAVPTDNSEGELVVVAGDGVSGFAFGEEIPTTRPSATTIAASGTGLDLSADEVYIGVRYTFTYQLSRIFPRKSQTRMSDTRGKLQLRRLVAQLHLTGYLQVTVQGTDTDPAVYTFDNLTEADEEFAVSLLSNAALVTITFESDHQLGCRLVGYSWEGLWHPRSQLR